MTASNLPITAPRLRFQISLLLGLLAGIIAHRQAVLDPTPRDFSLFRGAAVAALQGQNVYDAVPGLVYPLPGMLLVTPWTLLPNPTAVFLFMFLSGAAFAWALTAHGYAPLLGYFSPGMLFAAQVGQWPPMFAAAFVLAPLGVFLIVKPHVGLASFVARPTWWTVTSAVVCTLVAFAIQPTWFNDWRASAALGGAHLGAGRGDFQYEAPLMLTGGVLVLTALTRWRRPEARLLVMLACVPQSLHLYEIVPLALVPRGWKQCASYLVLSHAVWRVLRAYQPYPSYGEYRTASGTLCTLFIFLPLTAMVLRRPNEGVVPTWLERRIGAWPDWLRGRPVASDV